VTARAYLLALKLKQREVDDRTWMWIADHLPRKLVYWCAIRLGVHASSGEWSGEEVPGLLFMDALERWNAPGDDRF
jgi:hypothetical protein